MSFESWKIKHETKKANKQIAKKEKLVEALQEQNDSLTDVIARNKEAQHKLTFEEGYKKQMKEDKLTSDIRYARQKLFIQRDYLVKELIKSNREYKYLMENKPDGPVRQKELDRCSLTSKNAAYGLAIVTDAIDRLDDIPSEVRWREVMTDLTKGYKMMNSISSGRVNLFTKLAFLYQRARHDIKKDISVKQMERYYGKSIDTLLEEQTGDANAADVLVRHSAIDLDNQDEILEAVRWGTIYDIPPRDLTRMADEQCTEAAEKGFDPIYTPLEDLEESSYDFDKVLEDMPSMMS